LIPEYDCHVCIARKDDHGTPIRKQLFWNSSSRQIESNAALLHQARIKEKDEFTFYFYIKQRQRWRFIGEL